MNMGKKERNFGEKTPLANEIHLQQHRFKGVLLLEYTVDTES